VRKPPMARMSVLSLYDDDKDVLIRPTVGFTKILCSLGEYPEDYDFLVKTYIDIAEKDGGIHV